MATTAEEVRRRLVEHGLSIRDRVLDTMSYSYGVLAEQIRSISRTYKTDLDSLIHSLSTVKNLDLLVIYIMLISILYKYKNLSDDDLRNISKFYEEVMYDVFSASKTRRVLEEAGVDKEVANSVVSDLVKSLNAVSRRHNPPYLWIVKQRKVADFENDIRRLIFRGEGGSRTGRGVKLFLRMFIHETNIPLAVRIAYGQEVKKYILHGDMYTALVTLRSGAFEDVQSITAERIKTRAAKRILCENRGGRCDDVVLRLESVRGLVRHVGKISGDPVAYERGAYDVGVKYCKDLKCELCPMRNVCRKLTFIKLK
ncbi:MAG: hypothetical protein ABWK05_09755 [Pyrobaculum sp.]